MKLDIVITTYNRPSSVIALVNSIVENNQYVNKVIVVDSSETRHVQLSEICGVRLIYSDRKSQPYQRYLGYLETESDVVCFFDDDIIIKEKSLFYDLLCEFRDNEVVGVSARINYETSILINKKNKISSEIGNGTISWLGRTEPLPNIRTSVKYFPGPCMAYRREIVSFLFDQEMFELFEKKRAMGEDKAISMRASKFGKLHYLGHKVYLLHPPIESTYFNDEISFISKTIYSRLWLSIIYSETYNKSRTLAYFIFTLYFIKQLFLTDFKRFRAAVRTFPWFVH
jgi:glycosyltransferase involved in cell wall biosynthesis